MGSCKGIFYKGFEEKSSFEHKADEKSFRYKLDVYQRNFINFVYGNRTSIKTLGQDDENETRPGGTI